MTDNNQGVMNFLSVGRVGDIKAVNFDRENYSAKDALDAAEISLKKDEEIQINGVKVDNPAKTMVKSGDTILVLSKIEGND